MKKIEATYCIQVGDKWCAVLGNHYPNFPGNLSKESDSDEAVIERSLNAKVFCTQRLCDQTMVQYKFVVVCEPTCPDCYRIKQLKLEFARKPDVEDDSGEGLDPDDLGGDQLPLVLHEAGE